MKLPKIGDIIYIPSAHYIDRGQDDWEGGKATIDKVYISKTLPKDHINAIFIGIEGQSSTMHNYKSLLKEQEKLKKEYGDKFAYSKPDVREEFNESGGCKIK